MRNRSPFRLLSVFVFVFAGCAYEFDPETDRFACESSDDCLDGYVCAGHTMAEADVLSYCVKNTAATVGIRLAAGAPTLGFNDLTNTTKCSFEGLGFKAGMLTSDATTLGEPLTVGHYAEALAGSAAACNGTVDQFGAVSVLCTMPASDLSLTNTGAIWVATYDAEGADDPTRPENWWSFVYGGDMFDRDYPLFTVLTSKYDLDLKTEYEDNTNNLNEKLCSRAAKRECRNGQSILCTSCTSDAECPNTFVCDLENGGRCTPT